MADARQGSPTSVVEVASAFMMDEHGHDPVLVEQTLALLAPAPGEIAVDCTVGRGGHSMALARAVSSGKPGGGTIVGFDLDPANLDYAAGRVEAGGGRFIAGGTSFVSMPAALREQALRADVVLADLGFSSNQMDDPSRGFSFREDGPLDMRLDPRSSQTGADLLASMPEADLADMIRQYGEEPLAGRIARKLVQIRPREPILTTLQLARLVQDAYGARARTSRMHPATRTFMALRIAVNDELGALRALLDQIADAARRMAKEPEGGWLNAGARVAIISFHSLEDRLVKQTFATMEQVAGARRLTKKPMTADETEIYRNPRSRSAKLRAIRLAGSSGD